MSTTESRPAASRVEVVLPRPTKPEFKQLGGSDSDHFNQQLANQTLATLWTANSDEEQRNNQYLAATAALIGAKLQDELEGMLVSQMIAVHIDEREQGRSEAHGSPQACAAVPLCQSTRGPPWLFWALLGPLHEPSMCEGA